MLTFSRFYLASCLLALIALVAVLELGLLPALLSGLLVFNLVHFAAPMLHRIGVSNSVTKSLALTLVALIFTLLIAAIFSGMSQLTGGSENVVTLLKKMAEIIDTARVHLPTWAMAYFPSNIEELEVFAARWLREHAGQLQLVGRDVGILVVHIIVGMVIGGLIAVSSAAPSREPGPLAVALADRVNIL
ncbi:hypothetical protein NKH93_31515, partial [Mesorhizobium sp. M0954]